MTGVAVGVDAGGSSTVVAGSRDGVALPLARGGPANASSRGIAAAARTIVETIRACATAEEPAAVYVAAAGAGRDAVRDGLAAALAEAFPTARRFVDDDVRVALRAGVPEGPGIVLVAGTGSVAYAEAAVLTARVGGAGYLAGDEGSAFAIGMAAVRRLARVLDGRERGDETSALVARALGDDRGALFATLYDAPLDVARIAALAPSVVAFAGKGNRVATTIVQAAARDLGDLALAAARAVGLVDASPTIAFAGGLLRENSLLSFLLETRVTGDLPGCTIVRVRDEPVHAALRAAEAMLA